MCLLVKLPGALHGDAQNGSVMRVRSLSVNCHRCQVARSVDGLLHSTRAFSAAHLSLVCLSSLLQSGVSEVLYRRRVILIPNVATWVHAALIQKLQFDTDDHLEDDLPLRSRVLSPSTCFMRMERGPTTNHSESHAAGSNSTQRHAHVPTLHPLGSQPVLPASQILQNAQRAVHY